MATDDLRKWYMLNKDTGQTLVGQFEPEDVTEDLGSVYAERFTLNRRKAILQYLHGKTPTISFTATFFNETSEGPLNAPGDARNHLDTLKAWADRDPILGRPPVVTFWVGDSFLTQDSVIEAIAPAYMKPAHLGAFKGAIVTVALREFTAFDINAITAFDTRFHAAKRGDYYELVAEREYKDPLLGVVLRQRNPSRINLRIGDVVRLPAGTGTIRQEPITQTSIVFDTAFEKHRIPTAQRLRHEEMVGLRNRSKVSHILVT